MTNRLPCLFRRGLPEGIKGPIVGSATTLLSTGGNTMSNNSQFSQIRVSVFEKDSLRAIATVKVEIGRAPV